MHNYLVVLPSCGASLCCWQLNRANANENQSNLCVTAIAVDGYCCDCNFDSNRMPNAQLISKRRRPLSMLNFHWRCGSWFKPWFVCFDTRSSHHYKRDVSLIRSSLHRRHISLPISQWHTKCAFRSCRIRCSTSDLQTPEIARPQSAVDLWSRCGEFEWEKWLDVVRRLERANDEMWCVWTANNVRMPSTKMKFNESNVRFNLAWVSARTPHTNTHNNL